MFTAVDVPASLPHAPGSSRAIARQRRNDRRTGIPQYLLISRITRSLFQYRPIPSEEARRRCTEGDRRGRRSRLLVQVRRLIGRASLSNQRDSARYLAAGGYGYCKPSESSRKPAPPTHLMTLKRKLPTPYSPSPRWRKFAPVEGPGPALEPPEIGAK